VLSATLHHSDTWVWTSNQYLWGTFDPSFFILFACLQQHDNSHIYRQSSSCLLTRELDEFADVSAMSVAMPNPPYIACERCKFDMRR